MSLLAVLHASQVVTLTGPKRPRIGAEMSELAIIREGGMLVRDGKIESVGPSDEMEKNVGDAEIVDARGRSVMPGFVDAHAVPRELSPDEYLDIVVGEMLPRVTAEKLAEFCDVFCERGYFEVDRSRKILSAAEKHGLSLRGHVDQLTNSGGAKLMAEMGAITADHLERTDEQGIVALKKANVQPVLLPGSVYALGSSRYPRAREMIKAGLAVVLATDFNPGSSPTPSMSMVLSLACTQMKMSPAEAITASTVNAAFSLNRGDSIGSLEPGKVANFAIFDCEDYRELAYWFGVSQAYSVYVKGECVSRSGGL